MNGRSWIGMAPTAHPTTPLSIINVKVHAERYGTSSTLRVLLDATVEKNWISTELASRLGHNPSQVPQELSEHRQGQWLQSLGVMTLIWCRTDISVARSYEMEFQIASDTQVLNDASPMLIGGEDLSKDSGISTQVDGAHVFARTTPSATQGE